jgi:hypothetical protein
MKRTSLLILSTIIFNISFSQNVGIGTTTPITKLHVSGTGGNIATFNGGSGMWITLAEGGVNRGYIGSFAGNPEDIDFGTYGGNTTGKLHLTIQDVPKLTVEASGNIGIGTTDPLSLLHVTNGAILFDGTTGGTPESGTGTRMMWVPAKAAFRAGKVTGNLWDDANIGVNSVAMGNTTVASGFNAIALGSFAVATGDYSTSMGFNTIASGYNAVAIGGDTRASGTLSTAMGNNTTAGGDYSTAAGNTTTSKSFSGFVIGAFNDSTNAASPTNFNSLNRVFQIGNGTADNARNNAMTVLQNGNVGIATPTPKSALTIKHGGIIYYETPPDGNHAIAVWDSTNNLASTVLYMGAWNIQSTGYIGVGNVGTTGIPPQPKLVLNADGKPVIIGGTAPSATIPYKLVVENGDVQFEGSLSVNFNKGIIRNTGPAQLKQVVTSVTVNPGSIAAGATYMQSVSWSETFSAVPVAAYIGNVTGFTTGGWAELVLSIYNAGTNGCTLYVYNPKASTVSPGFTFNLIAIGPQ